MWIEQRESVIWEKSYQQIVNFVMIFSVIFIKNAFK